ncbi:hypothetical protein IX317_000597 [Fusobacterium sp. DD29]|uniref:helix-turn-helix domain-containing protein n=1 Tax=unclassified Fusobacterium TaxID=2648384 RepID=UPI001B8C92D0|nr:MULTISPECIES: helix-turn-helix transcriptional regulator [unclassified Fusobacterium]MBR8700281.1 hypothetical protein [Fusobacterium sp. DD45]MBR8710464.1 hypothetical protein [Fusobacterium sp. DD28]MBR8748936.1 hypothetical protein [Fusobacterium sp. DD29]MBR8751086.1 hypothetical protein [Fusobacterium sp. DD26]MBR8761242.1 hypothetical protein [Fusobacterium sp. DD25]
MKVNELIRHRRKQLGLTLKDVAKELGVSESLISRYESNDVKNMGIDKIVPLAKVLKCSPKYLMGWDADPEDGHSKLLNKAIDKIKSLGLGIEEINQSGNYIITKDGMEVRTLHEQDIIDLYNKKGDTLELLDFKPASQRFRWVARNARKMSDDDLQLLQNLMRRAFNDIDFDDDDD